MKTAFILYGSPDKRSGGFLYDRYLIDMLLSRGHRVKVFSQKQSFLPFQIFENSIRKFSSLTDFNPDIIIEDELNHASLFMVNRKLRQKCGAEIISVVHHLRSDEGINIILKAGVRLIEKLYLKSCSSFIFNSSSTRKSAEKLMKGECRNCITVYPGKDNLPLIKRKKRKRYPVVFLFAGNIISRKNPDLLIKVFKRIGGEKWKLIICGSGFEESSFYKKLIRLSSEYIETGRIIFTGHVSDEKLASLISRSDVLAVPSDWEGFGIIYLEAMRGGAVPLASESGGAAEIINNGLDGFLVPAGKAEALEKQIRLILDDPDCLNRMLPAVYGKAGKFLTWSGTMDNAADFIEKTAGSKKI